VMTSGLSSSAVNRDGLHGASCPRQSKLLGVHYRQRPENKQLLRGGYCTPSADNALLTVYTAASVQGVSVDCACIPGNNALGVGPGVGVVVH